MSKNIIFVGKRKTSCARVILKTGKGKITVNGFNYIDYFKRKSVANESVRPLVENDQLKKFDITANIRGGGLSSQSGALRHAISRALVEEIPNLKAPIKQNGYLTRDPRKVERKLYGHKKARKSFQFSKR